MFSLKQIQLSINTMFKRLKFFEISNREGKVLISERENELRVGDVMYMRDENGNVTVAVDGEYILVINGLSYKVKVVGGKVESIINAEDGSTVDVVTTAVPQQESVQQMKQVAQKESEKDIQKEMHTMSAFETYMYNEYLNDVTMDKYPFDECVKDMKERGYDCPECVCAAIKNRTVAHYIQQGLTIKEAIEKVIDDVTGNETLKYILRKNNEVANQQLGIKVEQANQKDEIDELKKEISELKEQIEVQKQEIVKMHSISKSKKERNSVNFDIDEYRKKYFLSK
ncbi:MAG: hypothetical protein QW051_02315 [Candidatus Aenigmatarchaeota archaeon]